jgi:hypothetical protein
MSLGVLPQAGPSAFVPDQEIQTLLPEGNLILYKDKKIQLQYEVMLSIIKAGHSTRKT